MNHNFSSPHINNGDDIEDTNEPLFKITQLTNGNMGDITHINFLNKQLEYLSENLEFYYKKKSNHLLNNIRAIIIYSNYTKQRHYLTFANKILDKLIADFVDKDGFFKFGSSHYQFIFS